MSDHFQGYRRRILIRPAPGRVSAAVEDDFHHMTVVVDHADGLVTRLEACTERAPWSLCPAAATFLETRLPGSSLAGAADADDPHMHCTHHYDLFVVAAAHAGETVSITYDITVSDAVDGLRQAEIRRDGVPLLSWGLAGLVLSVPADLAGQDLRRFAQWMDRLPSALHLAAQMLRRGILVSGGRDLPMTGLDTAAALMPRMAGACFTFQPAVAAMARRSPEFRRDFSDKADDLLRGGTP
ncbi:MAG: hypothetical protein PW843_00720 [Azospirillaceae bacterium]|nr:hypothetical protein [Azospirillaceae bacterium]